MDYTYWEITFISCEGNNRWVIARTSSDWSSDDVRDRIRTGGCGDDPATILTITESYDDDYSWDID